MSTAYSGCLQASTEQNHVGLIGSSGTWAYLGVRQLTKKFIESRMSTSARHSTLLPTSFWNPEELFLQSTPPIVSSGATTTKFRMDSFPYAFLGVPN